jgi:hypothetical protein
MRNSHYPQLPWTLNVVDPDDLESVPARSAVHGFAKAKRCRRIAHVYPVVSELPENVALGTRKEFRRLSTLLPPAVLGGHAVCFHRHTNPERLVSSGDERERM